MEANFESQDLQYHLTDRAQALGWRPERITVIDDDLGKSAITASGREGFQALVAAVGLGQVGIILITDVSRLGSAHKVLRFFRDQRLLFPRRRGSSRDEYIEWERPSMSAIYLTLKNPAYAGAYAYDKLHRTHLPGEAHKVVVHPLPQEEWPVLIPNAFPGYIPWEHYQRNQQRLRLNAQGLHWKRGAPRIGLAFLQGIALCARCGRP